MIEKAKRIFEHECKNDLEGIKPLYRPRDLILAYREQKKSKTYSWWKSENDKHNAIIFVPPTPGSILLKMLKTRFDELSADPSFKINFQCKLIPSVKQFKKLLDFTN